MSGVFSCGDNASAVQCFFLVLDHAPWMTTIALLGVTVIYNYDVVFFWLSVFALPINLAVGTLLNIISNPHQTISIVNSVQGSLTYPSFPSQFVFFLATCSLIYYEYYRMHNPAYMLFSMMIVAGLILYADVYIRIDHLGAMFYGAGVGTLLGVLLMILYVLVLDPLSDVFQKTRLGGLMGMRNWYNKRSYHTENAASAARFQAMLDAGGFKDDLEQAREFFNAYLASSGPNEGYPYNSNHPKYHYTPHLESLLS